MCSARVVTGDYESPIPLKRKNAADPIKKIEDIHRINNYFLATGNYRDNLLFTMGINFGLRCGDLLHIKVGDVVDENGTYKPEVCLIEEKTSKLRTVYLNDAVMDACDLYLNDGRCVGRDDYFFKSQSNHGKGENTPISVYSVERILKSVINSELGIPIHAGTHCMRKTFAYHVIQSAPDRTRAIEFLQKILGHSNQMTTLMYAGITVEEIQETYQHLNLGKQSPALPDVCLSSGLAGLTELHSRS
ncbi:MAG: tyrosine-type recombinase/integrase [Tannerellaceae bacterium]